MVRPLRSFLGLSELCGLCGRAKCSNFQHLMLQLRALLASACSGSGRWLSRSSCMAVAQVLPDESKCSHLHLQPKIRRLSKKSFRHELKTWRYHMNYFRPELKMRLRQKHCSLGCRLSVCLSVCHTFLLSLTDSFLLSRLCMEQKTLHGSTRQGFACVHKDIHKIMFL